MALSTTDKKEPAPTMKETPAVAKQGPAPSTAPVPTAEPAIPEGIDPVLLHRLYPDANNAEDAASKALAQGKKTAAEGAATIAAQQEEPTR